MKRLWPVLLSLCLWGCATHTVYVPAGKAVRLREPVYAAVWVYDSEGRHVPGFMTLPEGWYCLPDPGEDDG